MTLTRKIPHTDSRLQRHVVHDERSRGFAFNAPVDKSTWQTKTIKIYDPVPNPSQVVGNCTAVSKCVQFNAVGNRRQWVRLGMDTADKLYRIETRLDPFPGTWEPDDTGSNGLAACKAAQQLGLGGTYRWLFGGADEVVQAIMTGLCVSVGTRWDESMSTPDEHGVIHPGGVTVGGHQWTVRGYNRRRDMLMGRCWWGDFRDFWIARADLGKLLVDNGDAHVQVRA